MPIVWFCNFIIVYNKFWIINFLKRWFKRFYYLFKFIIRRKTNNNFIDIFLIFNKIYTMKNFIFFFFQIIEKIFLILQNLYQLSSLFWHMREIQGLVKKLILREFQLLFFLVNLNIYVSIYFDQKYLWIIRRY